MQSIRSSLNTTATCQDSLLDQAFKGKYYLTISTASITNLYTYVRVCASMSVSL